MPDLKVKIGADGSQLIEGFGECIKSELAFINQTQALDKELKKLENSSGEAARKIKNNILGMAQAGSAMPRSMEGLSAYGRQMNTAAAGSAPGKALGPDGVAGGVLMGNLSLQALQKAGEFVDQFVEKCGEIEHASARAGVSSEEWQKLAYAAEKTGATSEQLGNAFKILEKNVITGSAEAAKGFDLIGMKAEDLQGKSPEQMFDDVARAIAALPDPAARSAAAMRLFGESGNQLVPMLKRLDELKDKAPIIGQGALDGAKAYRTGMETIKESATKTISYLMENWSMVWAAAGSATSGVSLDEEMDGNVAVMALERKKQEREQARAVVEAKAAEKASKAKEEADFKAEMQRRQKLAQLRGETDDAAATMEQMGLGRVRALGGGDLKYGQDQIEAEIAGGKKIMAAKEEAAKKAAEAEKKRQDEYAKAAANLAKANDAYNEALLNKGLKDAAAKMEKDLKAAEAKLAAAEDRLKDAQKAAGNLGAGDSVQDELALAGSLKARRARKKQVDADDELKEKLGRLDRGDNVRLTSRERQRLETMAAEERAAGAGQKGAQGQVKGIEAAAAAAKDKAAAAAEAKNMLNMQNDMKSAAGSLKKLETRTFPAGAS